jgi:hypothetical protein
MRTAHRQGAKDFPVVCVGGSAGGLDAYIRLLRNLPADMGVAVVIINHLRTVSTLLHEIHLIRKSPLLRPRRSRTVAAHSRGLKKETRAGPIFEFRQTPNRYSPK